MSIIELKNVTYQYTKNNKAVSDVSFTVEKGEFVCILGHNGSGKSTLAKLIVGLLKAKSGDIIINGTKLTEETVDKVRLDLGIVFQNPDNQFVGMNLTDFTALKKVTVKDDIAFGLENRQIKRDEILRRINEYAKVVDMEEFLDRNPESLSGGQKQRVAIAGVLACEPEIIVFDESTSMLDPKGVKEVLDAIRNLKGNRTIIYITHNLNEALLADKVIVMNGGKVVLDGTKEEVFKAKNVLKNASLDTLDHMKLIDLIEENGLKNKEEIVDALWQLAYQK